MPSPTSILPVLWSAWLLSWLIASLWAAKAVTQQTVRDRFAQTLPVWIGAVLLFRSPGGLFATTFYQYRPWIGWLAVALAAAGFAIAWWARIHLGRLWSAAVTLKAGHSIIRTGPYAYSRHPIYSGLLLAVLGSAVARGTLGGLLGFALIAIGFLAKLRQEEQFLTTRFGADYDAYRRDVKALVPGVW
jgi:protein-S-isoprenylcysteine O-methyltransferase Ste14